MRQVTASGKTVDQAIESALKQLQVPKSEVSIQVIDEGSRGFFGIFGASRAIVQVTVQSKEKPFTEEVKSLDEDVAKLDSLEEKTTKKSDSTDEDLENRIEQVKQYLSNIANEMEITDISFDIKVKRNVVYFHLASDKIARIIGKRGQTLNALQTLAQLVFNKEAKSFYQVILDAENYRAKRKETLRQLANRMADRALKIKRKVTLEPMPSFERKIIHKTLENRNGISTRSKGAEPYRHIVIDVDSK